MRKSTKLSILCISATVLAFGCLTGAVAQTAPYTYENGTSAASRGVIEIGGGAKFDSRDLEKIYTEVSAGKEAIETAITDADLAAPTKAGTVYTFAELATGVNPWDDLQAGLGYYSKDSEGNYVKGSTKRTTLYNSVNSIESLDKAIAEDNISYKELGQQEVIDNPASFEIISSEKIYCFVPYDYPNPYSGSPDYNYFGYYCITTKEPFSSESVIYTTGFVDSYMNISYNTSTKVLSCVLKKKAYVKNDNNDFVLMDIADTVTQTFNSQSSSMFIVFP